MILADLMKEVSYGNSKVGQKFEDSVKEKVTEFSNTVQSFLQIIKTHNDHDMTSESVNVIYNLIEKTNEALKKERDSINFLDMKYIEPIESIKLSKIYNISSPNSYELTTQKYSSIILKSHRTKINNVIEVAEKLGLLIIPTKYINVEVLDRDTEAGSYDYRGSISKVVRNFGKECDKNNLSSWLICPIQYYDIQAHAKDMSFEFFVPTSIRQAFTSIKIILPMLVGLISQIDSLSKKLDNVNSELQNIKQTLISQQQQINRLQEELTQQRIQIAEQAAREREMQQELELAQARIQWELFDPMLIALPKNITNINMYDGNVALGPAWGPEIDPLLCDLLGLTTYPEKVNYKLNELKKY